MNVNGTHYRSIWYDQQNQKVKIIDQRWLPHEFKNTELESLNDFATAIRDMWVRGAPLIGATAAYGVAAALLEEGASDKKLQKIYNNKKKIDYWQKSYKKKQIENWQKIYKKKQTEKQTEK